MSYHDAYHEGVSCIIIGRRSMMGDTLWMYYLIDITESEIQALPVKEIRLRHKLKQLEAELVDC